MADTQVLRVNIKWPRLFG